MYIRYDKIAVKHIEVLDRASKQRIKTAIEKLPFGDIEKLKGYQNDYRLRVGNFRVLFSLENDIITVKMYCQEDRHTNAYRREHHEKRNFKKFN